MLAGLARGRAAIVSWDLLELLPALAAPYPHVFALDPPPAADAVGFCGGTAGRRLCPLRLGPGGGGGRPHGASRPGGTCARASPTSTARCASAEMTALGELDTLLDPIASRADCAFALRVLLDLSLVQIEQGMVRLARVSAHAARGVARIPRPRGAAAGGPAALGGDAAPIAA